MNATRRANRENVERDIIDKIDSLVEEQLARGPIDDYHADRYPDCNLCPHHWHGIKCESCDCEASTGEVCKPALHRYTYYANQVESVRYTDNRNGRGYTIADIEAMRWPRPVVRFWATGENGELTELTGEVEIIDEVLRRVMLDTLDTIAALTERREIAHAIEVGTPEEIAACEACWRAGEERSGCSCLGHDEGPF